MYAIKTTYLVTLLPCFYSVISLGLASSCWYCSVVLLKQVHSPAWLLCVWGSVCERVLAEDYTVLMNRTSRPTCWESLKLQEASIQAYYQEKEVLN